MTVLLTEVNSSLTALLLAVVMLVAWTAGWSWGRYLRREGQQVSPSKLDDAVLALLGLLLAFTFSMSLAKHEQRRLMLVNDSNAIGDFYTCVSLLKEPVRSKLRTVLRQYVEHRLSVSQATMDEATFERKLSEVREMHDSMQSLVGEAIDAETPLVVPLVNTLNEVTSCHTSRLSAGRDRLPVSVVMLLFLASITSMVLTGRHPGVSGAPRFGAAVGFTTLVCMVVWVTLDLNQPNRGWITISQEPLHRLLAGMSK